MTPVPSKAELMADLKSRAVALGLSVHDQGADGFSGEKKSIQAKWLSVKCQKATFAPQQTASLFDCLFGAKNRQ